jgi:AcrR family transcriptional regulator
MSKRNESVAETRQRIIDAAVDLHGSVGPAQTTVAAIAERAGVTRLTVYRHFPDVDSMFAACSAHWMSQQVPPRPDEWARITDPYERLRAALTDLYRYYRDARQMLVLVNRDAEHVPEAVRSARLAGEARQRDVVLSAFKLRGAKGARVEAVVGHAMSFGTWHSLCAEQQLSQQDAIAAMVMLVEAVGTGLTQVTRRKAALVRQ